MRINAQNRQKPWYPVEVYCNGEKLDENRVFLADEKEGYAECYFLSCGVLGVIHPVYVSGDEDLASYRVHGKIEIRVSGRRSLIS